MGDVLNMEGKPIEPSETISWQGWAESVDRHMKTNETCWDIAGVRFNDLENENKILKHEVSMMKLLLKPKCPWYARWF